MKMHLFVALLVASAGSGLSVELLRGVPLENGALVDVQIVRLPNKQLTADDYVKVCRGSGGQPVCNGGYSCTEDNACAPLSMEEPYCNSPMRGVARHLGFQSAMNPFFRDICAYVPDYMTYENDQPIVGGACAGPNAYRSANTLQAQNIQPYTLCATPLQTGSPTGFLASQGPCSVESDCVMSPRYPLMYPGSSCALAVLHDGTVSTESFSTVSGKDVLSINGKDYSGSKGPTSVHVRSGDLITWKSSATQQGPYTNAGWRLCLKRSLDGSPARVQNLTHQLEAEKQRRRQEEKEAARRSASLEYELQQSKLNLQRSMLVVQQQQQQVQKLWQVDTQLKGKLDKAEKTETELQNALNTSSQREAEAVRRETQMRGQLHAAQNNAYTLIDANNELEEQLDAETTRAKQYKQKFSVAAANLSDERAHAKLRERQMQHLRTQLDNYTNASAAKMEQLKAQARQATQNASRFRLEADGYRSDLSVYRRELDQSLQETDTVKREARATESSLRERLNASRWAEAKAKLQEAEARDHLTVAEEKVADLTDRNRDLGKDISDEQLKVNNLSQQVADANEREGAEKARLERQQTQLQDMKRDLHRYANTSLTIAQQDRELRQAAQNQSRLQTMVQELHKSVSNLDIELTQVREDAEKQSDQAAFTESSLRDRLVASQHAEAEAKLQEKSLLKHLQVQENETKELQDTNQQLQQHVNDEQLQVKHLTREVADARVREKDRESELQQKQAQLQKVTKDLHRYANASSVIASQDQKLQQEAQNKHRLQLTVQDLKKNVSVLDIELNQARNDTDKEKHEVAQLKQDMKDKKAEMAGAMAAEEETIATLEHDKIQAQKIKKDLEEKTLKMEKQKDSWQWGVCVSLALIAFFGLMFCVQKRSDKSKKLDKLGKLDEPLLKAEAGQCEAPQKLACEWVAPYEPSVTVAEWTDEQGLPVKSIQVAAPGRDFRTGNRTIRGTLEENCNGVNGVKLTLTKEPDISSDFMITEGAASPSGEWTRTFDFQDGHWKVQNEDFDAHGVWQVDLAYHDTGRKWCVAPQMDMASDVEDDDPSPMNYRNRRRSSTAGTITTQASSDDVGRKVTSPKCKSRTNSIDLDEHAGPDSDEGSAEEVDPYAVEWSQLRGEEADGEEDAGASALAAAYGTKIYNILDASQAKADDDLEGGAPKEDCEGQASGSASDSSANSQALSKTPSKRQNLQAPLWAAGVA